MSIWLPIIVLAVPIASLVLRSPTVITKIGPNPLIGIRTVDTLYDSTAWTIAHRKAWPYVRTANLICIAILIGVAGWAATLTGNAQSLTIGWGTAVGIVVWFGMNLLGTRVGLRAVQAHNG